MGSVLAAVTDKPLQVCGSG